MWGPVSRDVLLCFLIITIYFYIVWEIGGSHRELFQKGKFFLMNKKGESVVVSIPDSNFIPSIVCENVFAACRDNQASYLVRHCSWDIHWIWCFCKSLWVACVVVHDLLVKKHYKYKNGFMSILFMDIYTSLIHFFLNFSN